MEYFFFRANEIGAESGRIRNRRTNDAAATSIGQHSLKNWTKLNWIDRVVGRVSFGNARKCITFRFYRLWRKMFTLLSRDSTMATWTIRNVWVYICIQGRSAIVACVRVKVVRREMYAFGGLFGENHNYVLHVMSLM